MNNDKSSSTNRGGNIKGSGRKFKSKAGETKPVRVPVIYAGIVRELITHLDNACEGKNNNTELKSDPYKFISAKNKNQTITFTIKCEKTN